MYLAIDESKSKNTRPDKNAVLIRKLRALLKRCGNAKNGQCIEPDAVTLWGLRSLSDMFHDGCGGGGRSTGRYGHRWVYNKYVSMPGDELRVLI